MPVADWNRARLQHHLPRILSLPKVPGRMPRQDVIERSGGCPNVHLRLREFELQHLLPGHEVGCVGHAARACLPAQAGRVKGLGQSVITDFGLMLFTSVFQIVFRKLLPLIRGQDSHRD